MAHRMIPFQVYYDPKQTASTNSSFSPSAGKPALVVDSWRQLPVPLEFRSFERATRKQLYLTHAASYVDGVLDLKTPNGFGNTLPEVAEALPWVCGSAIAAALGALENKRPTFSPTSGAHHAYWNSGGGFCTFNSLVLAAQTAYAHGAQRVGIIDLDQHFGDGTHDIIQRLKLYFLHQYSFGAEHVRPGAGARRWLDGLEEKLGAFRNYDLVLFNAGADPHVNDPLGGTLSTSEMMERDEIVYRTMKRLGVPVATMLAGGYQKDDSGGIRPVLDLHDQTMLACHKIYNLEGTL